MKKMSIISGQWEDRKNDENDENMISDEFRKFQNEKSKKFLSNIFILMIHAFSVIRGRILKYEIHLEKKIPKTLF